MLEWAFRPTSHLDDGEYGDCGLCLAAAAADMGDADTRVEKEFVRRLSLKVDGAGELREGTDKQMRQRRFVPQVPLWLVKPRVPSVGRNRYNKCNVTISDT